MAIFWKTLLSAGNMMAIAAVGWVNPSTAASISVVAAENVYGDIAKQLGGDHVDVMSILTNPNQDPHLFEASASTARALAGAALVIYNGLDYDPWMEKLLAVTPNGARAVIIVGEIGGKKVGENPHLWYEPRIVAALARVISTDLTARDPALAPDYKQRLETFEASTARLDAQIQAMHAKYAGVAITATEPVFQYMADAIGLVVRNPEFQLAVMNETEPSARNVGAFQDDLRRHKVKVLLYNSQATNNLAQRMREIAETEKIPVVDVTETEPPATTYQDWMGNELDALDAALASAGR
jgi:zinc/manganese transport system substrate-binding protein